MLLWNQVGENSSWNSIPAKQTENSSLILGTRVQPRSRTQITPRRSQKHAFGTFLYRVPINFSSLSPPQIQVKFRTRNLNRILTGSWNSKPILGTPCTTRVQKIIRVHMTLFKPFRVPRTPKIGLYESIILQLHTQMCQVINTHR